MIRRLILYRPISDDEARAATAWAEKLGDAQLTISYRTSPVPMRVLLFDAVGQPGKKRQVKARLVTNAVEPEGPIVDCLQSAMRDGDVVFNVFTGHERDRATAYSWTDAVFTVAFPEGEAVAWFARVGGGIAPGVAASCLRPWHANRNTAFFMQGVEWFMLRDSARFLFFKRRPASVREDEERVMAFARDLLDGVPTGRGSVTPSAPAPASENFCLRFGG